MVDETPRIKTYIIQYGLLNGWQNYLDSNKLSIELLSLEAARSIARDLAKLDGYPPYLAHWRIVDSTGSYHDVPLVSNVI